MELSEHFPLDEMIESANADRLGINNYPDEPALENLRHLTTVAETVRTLLGFPMKVTSGYRCPELNAATPGSSKTSAHTLGLAMDFKCPQFGTPLEVCRAIAASDIEFDQVIHEYGSWCHFAVAPAGSAGRRELLTIDRNGTRKGLEA